LAPTNATPSTTVATAPSASFAPRARARAASMRPPATIEVFATNLRIR
jgi:hypothetical protein